MALVKRGRERESVNISSWESLGKLRKGKWGIESWFSEGGYTWIGGISKKRERERETISGWESLGKLKREVGNRGLV